jgi:uncharacterized protein YraI
MTNLLRCSRKLLLACLFLVAPPAVGQQMVSVSDEEVNMRSGPGTQHAVEWILYRGYPLRVIDKQGRWRNWSMATSCGR